MNRILFVIQEVNGTYLPKYFKRGGFEVIEVNEFKKAIIEVKTSKIDMVFLFSSKRDEEIKQFLQLMNKYTSKTTILALVENEKEESLYILPNVKALRRPLRLQSLLSIVTDNV